MVVLATLGERFVDPQLSLLVASHAGKLKATRLLKALSVDHSSSGNVLPPQIGKLAHSLVFHDGTFYLDRK